MTAWWRRADMESANGASLPGLQTEFRRFTGTWSGGTISS
jgi:hypothetical protein